MTTFDTRFAARAGRRLLGDPTDPTDLGRFGEWIVYRPRNGRARRVRAMVERGPPTQIEEEQRLIGDSTTIEVYNDRTSGIAFDEIDTGGDKIEWYPIENGPKRTLAIRKILDRNNAGLVRLYLA